MVFQSPPYRGSLFKVTPSRSSCGSPGFVSIPSLSGLPLQACVRTVRGGISVEVSIPFLSGQFLQGRQDGHREHHHSLDRFNPFPIGAFSLGPSLALHRGLRRVQGVSIPSLSGLSLQGGIIAGTINHRRGVSIPSLSGLSLQVGLISRESVWGWRCFNPLFIGALSSGQPDRARAQPRRRDVSIPSLSGLSLQAAKYQILQKGYKVCFNPLFIGALSSSVCSQVVARVYQEVFQSPLYRGSLFKGAG